MQQSNTFVSFILKMANIHFQLCKIFQKDGYLYDNTQHSTNIVYRPQGVCKKSSDIFW